MAQPSIELPVELSRSDLTRFYWWVSLLHQRWSSFKLTAAAIVVVSVYLGATGPWAGVLAAVAQPLITLGLFVLAIHWMYQRAAARQYRLISVRRPCTIRFSEDGIVDRDPLETRQLRWEAARGIHRTKHALYVDVAPMVLILPRRYFASEQDMRDARSQLERWMRRGNPLPKLI